MVFYMVIMIFENYVFDRCKNCYFGIGKIFRYSVLGNFFSY